MHGIAYMQHVNHTLCALHNNNFLGCGIYINL